MKGTRLAMFFLIALATVMAFGCEDILNPPVPGICNDWCGFVERASQDQDQPYSASGCKWGCLTGHESAAFCDCANEYEMRYDCYLYYLDDDYDVAACALGFSGDGVCGSKDSDTWGDIVSDDCDSDIDDYNDCISDCRPR